MGVDRMKYRFDERFFICLKPLLFGFKWGILVL